MVKTDAEQRGWQVSDPTPLFDAVATIAAETGDEDIDRRFEVASILHTNFCEGWYSAGRVERGLRDIKIFIDKAATVGQRVTESPVATATRFASTIRAVSNSAPNDRREQSPKVAEFCANSATDGDHLLPQNRGAHHRAPCAAVRPESGPPGNTGWAPEGYLRKDRHAARQPKRQRRRAI